MKTVVAMAEGDTPACAAAKRSKGPDEGQEGKTMNSLNSRRATFIYEAGRLQAIAAGCPIVPEPYADREADFREQFEARISKQCDTTGRLSSPRELHEEWVEAYRKNGWRYGPVRDVQARTHPDMVPFEELGELEQDKDMVFFLLCEMARQWIRK